MRNRFRAAIRSLSRPDVRTTSRLLSALAGGRRIWFIESITAVWIIGVRGITRSSL